MKKLFTIFLAVCMMFTIGTVLSACGDNEQNTRTHTHTFDTAWSSDNTEHWHACTGEDCTEVNDKAIHTWNQGSVTTPATTTTEGVKTFTCTVCGKTKTEAIAKHTHTFDTVWSSDNTEHWHACTGEDCTEVEDKAIHTWNQGSVTTPATTTTEGVKTYTCTVCGKTKTEAIAKLVDNSVAGKKYLFSSYHGDTYTPEENQQGFAMNEGTTIEFYLNETAKSFTPNGNVIQMLTYVQDGNTITFTITSMSIDGVNQDISSAPASFLTMTATITGNTLTITHQNQGTTVVATYTLVTED